MTWGSRKPKYGNRKTTDSAGRSFGSKLEASVFGILKLREKSGELQVLQQQDHVRLSDAGITYIADFKCMDTYTQELFWVEAKGHETPEWRIKRRLWMHYGPGKLEIYKGTAARPFLHETIIPKGNT